MKKLTQRVIARLDQIGSGLRHCEERFLRRSKPGCDVAFMLLDLCKDYCIKVEDWIASSQKALLAMTGIGVIIVLQAACSKEPKLDGSHLETVQARSYANTLFYTGTIRPLKTLVIPSPADGAIIDMPFQYGEHVKTGQLLYMLSSAKFLSDYKTALLQYLKAKNEFGNSEAQLKEGEFLHKNELISDDEFKNKKSNFYASQLSLVQAKDALENLIHQLNLKEGNLYNLSIADIDKINDAMHLKTDSDSLRVTSPTAGVVLSMSKNEDEVKKLAKGDVVKQGDVLAIIGDMSGLSVRIKVNEMTVNQIKAGQKVSVTGAAFPDDLLTGEISRVDRQAEVSNGGMPTFAVEVIVPTLTQAQQQYIHVGMSAKVEINIDDAPQIIIPINAIQEKNGNAFVKRYDNQSHSIIEIAVKTGTSTIDSVTVTAGLKSGDKIVVPDKA